MVSFYIRCVLGESIVMVNDRGTGSWRITGVLDLENTTFRKLGLFLLSDDGRKLL
jgi:hypothetical protein